MQDYPHNYVVAASAFEVGDVNLEGDRLPAIPSAPPAEFGGPGDQWSPETLLVSAVAGCLILSFRAIARGSKLPWVSLECKAEGILERVDKVTQFTEYRLHAELTVPEGTNEERADRLLNRAKQFCLVTNSLKGKAKLETTIKTAA
jgi:organic hydroperoxide reductase OsmC/OhrA